MRIKSNIPICLLLLLPATLWAAPDIQHWTLDNGARVYFVETHALPMVQLRVVLDAASSRDPSDKRGLSVLTNALLDEGTGELDADAIAARFEGLGAEYNGSSQRDMATVDLRSLSNPTLLQPALDLLARILSAPSFPQAGLERERQRALVALQQHAQSPATVIEKAFYRQLYHEHPYQEDPLGDVASLKAVTREDLIAHHRRYYVGRNAVLAIVGDVSRREAKKISRQILGQLSVGVTPPPLPPVPELKQPHNRVIEFPATQSHIRLGQPGMTRTDPDYFPLYVGNYILGGGGLVSRLSDEVREKRGLSYSVYSYFLPMRSQGPFMIGLQTKNNQRQQALAVVRKVLKDFVAQGPTEKELEAAKKHLTGGFPLRLDSNKKIAEYLAMIGFYSLPLTYLDDFIPRIEAVTVDQIRDAFKRRVHPERLVTMIVGGQA
jgi:zinc protease